MTHEEIQEAYQDATDKRSVEVNIERASQASIRHFLERVDENLKVRDLIAALEADWS